jgi:hypothetical protein
MFSTYRVYMFVLAKMEFRRPVACLTSCRSSYVVIHTIEGCHVQGLLKRPSHLGRGRGATCSRITTSEISSYEMPSYRKTYFD